MYLRSGIVLLFSFCLFKGYSQDMPNLSDLGKSSGNSASATQLANVPVDLFHGTPSLSVPIFSYSKDNFGLGVSLSYQPGIKLLQGSSDEGLGWYLQAGGMITRTVRGVPDDLPEGYLNTSTIPGADFRTYKEQFYNDSFDTKQDVFNFNFCGRGGKFFIGRNKVITTVPLQNINIIPEFVSGQINSFKVITEDGTQYLFRDVEKSTIFGPMWNGYYATPYATAWALTYIVPAFSQDTVKFKYLIDLHDYQFAYPQIGYYYTSTGVQQSIYKPTATNFSYVLKITKIEFPGKTSVGFYYDTLLRTAGVNPTLKRIEIGDSIFRRGFFLEYDSANYAGGGDRKPRLRKVTPYFAKEKGRSYQFSYDSTTFDPPLDSVIANARDHWGYYNGHNSVNIMPGVLPDTVNRNINLELAKVHTLNTAFIPGTGYITYDYESNDRLAYKKVARDIQVGASAGSNDTITLNQVFNQRHRFIFRNLAYTARLGSSPASSGSVYLQCYIKSPDLLTTYASRQVNIDSLFYSGYDSWDVNVPNGSYRLVTSPGGGSISGNPAVDITWENRFEDTAKFTALGGLRIKKVLIRSSLADSTGLTTSYKYVREDGKSSGFLGDIPISSYPYTEYNSGGTVLNNYTVLASDPLDDIPGNDITSGYARVEVITGTSALSAGKTVYEYSDLKDAGTNQFSSIAPFTPQEINDWALGAPKRIILYDSAGRKVKSTQNNFSLLLKNPDASNNSSLKLIKASDVVNGSTITNVYDGDFYSFSTGRLLLNNSVDSSFFTDGSVKTSTTSYTYDTVYYNVKKVTNTYNSALGQVLEKRMYYPYDYTIGGAIGKLRDSGITAAPVSTEEWITGDGNPRLLNASITDLQQLATGQIRPSTAYIFKTNKPIPEATIGAFDPAHLVRSSTYFKPAATYDLYDSSANLLQSTNLLTGISNCTVMDYNRQLPVASVSNAVYSDIAYTGFESDGTGNWTIGDTSRYSLNYRSGKFSYNIANGNISKSGLNSSRTYLLTVWASVTGLGNPSITVNGTTLSNELTTGPGASGKWHLYSVKITGATSVTVSGTGIIDELRLYPENANMTSTTFEPNVGITSTDNASNIISFFEYDNLMRPSVTRDKDHYIIKKMTYSDTAYLVGVTGAGAHVGYPGIERTITIYCGDDPKYKAVNGVCEEGTRHNLGSFYNEALNEYECVYRWEWSDGTHSDPYTEMNVYNCDL